MTGNAGLSFGVAAGAATFEATLRRRYPAAHFELGETFADGSVQAVWVEPKRLAVQQEMPAAPVHRYHGRHGDELGG
jgi:hypothetical protein